MQRTSDGVHVFEIEDIHGDGGDDGFHFEAAMISTCSPIFDELEDNYDVEQRLIDVGVIDGTCDCDSESCALVIRFNDHHSVEEFLARLNKYLDDKARA